jgi:large subunit ribosomal protein L24
MVGLRIKKNDTVIVITGKNKGAKGRVLTVKPETNRLTVEGVNMIKKHQKPNKQYQQGGIIEKEGPLHISNTMLVCPKCSKPTRIAAVILEGGKKQRTCKKCKEVID